MYSGGMLPKTIVYSIVLCSLKLCLLIWKYRSYLFSNSDVDVLTLWSGLIFNPTLAIIGRPLIPTLIQIHQP